MATKKIPSDRSASELLADIARLCDNPRYSDMTLQVGDVNFPCHKLILALRSSYFHETLFQAPAQTVSHRVPLNDVAPEDVKNVLNFMYKGEIELDNETVCRIVRLAKLFHLDELKQICFRFMTGALDVENCLQYWTLAEDQDDSGLRVKSLEMFVQDFTRVMSITDLKEVTEDLMEVALERDDLNVSSEMDACQILMKWFDVQMNLGRPVTPFKLLSLIRWSGIPIEYIKSKIVHCDIVLNDRRCFEYLSKVFPYRVNGTQFEGLRTHHRPSTGLETCVVLIGCNNGKTARTKCCRVSLHRQHNAAIASVPAAVGWGNAACVGNNQIYVCGIGASYKETWRWDSVGVWARCGDMVEGRRRHCVAFVGSSSMYAIGGLLESADDLLSSIEEYDTVKNKWQTAGQMVINLRSAGCVSLKLSVFLFGGKGRQKTADEEDASLDLIQVFDVTTKQCTVLTLRLPQSECLLRTALWDNLIVLMNNRTCLVFDQQRNTIERRDQFAAGVSHFGLILDNETLFVVGGGNSRKDSDGELTWSCTDEVKHVQSSLEIHVSVHFSEWRDMR
jgi:hypothetical protein